METTVEELRREMAVVSRLLSAFPASLRKRMVAASIAQRCGLCLTRVPIDERVYRAAGGSHWCFHEHCVDLGVLQKRVEASKSRTPIARARLQRAKRQIAAAQHGR